MKTKTPNDAAENKPLTRAEIHDLHQVVRRNAKVRSMEIDAQAAVNVAMVDTQLAACYPATHAAFVDLMRQARELVAPLDKELRKRCKAMGIPEIFRPHVGAGWSDRGENAYKERRQELRRAAISQIEAGVEQAKRDLLRKETMTLNALTAEGITSQRGKELLSSLPTVEELLPKVDVQLLENATPFMSSYERWGHLLEDGSDEGDDD